jgi:hypothetical protein
VVSIFIITLRVGLPADASRGSMNRRPMKNALPISEQRIQQTKGTNYGIFRIISMTTPSLYTAKLFLSHSHGKNIK